MPYLPMAPSAEAPVASPLVRLCIYANNLVELSGGKDKVHLNADMRVMLQDWKGVLFVVH
jgi:hypothetical protein